ncbi:MAG: dienelactone hydrolase family protein [Planctomycetota bacterium]
MAESFVNVLDAWGAANPPRMARQEGEDVVAWQDRFRDALESLRGPLPDRVEPQAEIVESVEAGDHTRHRLRIPVSEVTTLAAYLLVPADLEPGERRPGLVALHGHHPNGIDALAGVVDCKVPYALNAVRAGYVTIVPAWWGWPGRDGHLGLIGNRDKCNCIQMAAKMYGLNVLDLHVQDGRAAIDVLADRPEVDAERIGCIGHSYGGRTTMWLTLFDERVRAALSSGAMNTFRERSLKLTSCGIQYLPGLLRVGDVPELYSLIAPRPLQLQAGEGDPLITPADRDHIADVVLDTYESLDAETDFEFVLHAEGHTLAWDRAEAFFAAHLHSGGRD